MSKISNKGVLPSAALSRALNIVSRVSGKIDASCNRERAREHHRRHRRYRQAELLQQHVHADERNAILRKLGGNRIHRRSVGGYRRWERRLRLTRARSSFVPRYATMPCIERTP